MEQDKKKHFVFGLIGGIIVALISPAMLLPAFAAVWCAVGVGIEIYQLVTKTGTFEWFDIVAHIAGTILGIIIMWKFRKEQ